MAFLGAVAAGAAGNVGGSEELTAVGVEGEVVGGAIGKGMDGVWLVGFPEGVSLKLVATTL